MTYDRSKVSDQSGGIGTDWDEGIIKGEGVSIEKILEDRGQSYGNFSEGAGIMQSLKLIMHSTPKWASLQSDQREAMEMFASKIGRLLNGDVDHLDSWRDIEGYSRLVSDRLQKGEEDEPYIDPHS